MEFLDTIKEYPILFAAAVAAMASLRWGLRLIWGAFVAMAVRAIDQVAVDHHGDRESLVDAARELDDNSTTRRRVESLLMSRMPETVIDAAIKQREEQGRTPGE